MRPKPANCQCDRPDNYELRDSECPACNRLRMRRIDLRLTPEQRAYDNFVDPLRYYHHDFQSGCSCHINPPCSYCTSKSDDDEDPA